MRVPAAPEFSRPQRVEALRESGGGTFAFEAETDERAAAAARYDVISVETLACEAEIAPERDGFRVRGLARAELTQRCVVTLEPMTTTLREAFDILFLPGGGGAAPTHEVEIGREDEPEPLGVAIDPAEIAAEAVALAIDPWPRSAEAAFEGRLQGPPGAEPLTDEAARPFAALSALKRRMEGQ